MRDRTCVAKIATTKTDTFLEVTVSYDKGGICYSTYKRKPRAYYLSVGPVSYEARDGVVWRKFGMFSGRCAVIEETQRFNQRRFDELAATAADSELAQQLIDDVLQRNPNLAVVAKPDAAEVGAA